MEFHCNQLKAVFPVIKLSKTYSDTLLLQTGYYSVLPEQQTHLYCICAKVT